MTCYMGGLCGHWKELQMNAMAKPRASEFLLHLSKAVLDELIMAGMPEVFWACVNL